MDIAEIQTLLRSATEQAIRNLDEVDQRRASGDREGQYALDLVVDGPLVDQLLFAGLGVLSEEAGVFHADRELLAVVDPVDGSTNASRRLPWFNTSIAVFDSEGPLVALVENHVTRDRFEAVRGHGATKNGVPLSTPGGAIATGVVGVNGVPPAENPWAQFRCFGASALDLCAVADGSLDGYVDFDHEAHGVWDYAAAFLVCAEAGVTVLDAFGRDLLHRDHAARRTPVAAQNEQDLEVLRALRAAAQQP